VVFHPRFHESRGIPSQAEKCCFLKERRCSMELFNIFFYGAATAQLRLGAPHFLGFKITYNNTHTHTHTLTHTTGRTPLNEGSARLEAGTYRTHSKHKKRTSMPSAGIEPAIPEIVLPHTYALHHTATGFGE